MVGTVLADNCLDSSNPRAVDAVDELVQGYYQAFLDRPAAAPGLCGWVSLLRRGGSYEEGLAAVRGSDEFFARR